MTSASESPQRWTHSYFLGSPPGFGSTLPAARSRPNPRTAGSRRGSRATALTTNWKFDNCLIYNNVDAFLELLRSEKQLSTLKINQIGSRPTPNNSGGVGKPLNTSFSTSTAILSSAGNNGMSKSSTLNLIFNFLLIYRTCFRIRQDPSCCTMAS